MKKNQYRLRGLVCLLLSFLLTLLLGVLFLSISIQAGIGNPDIFSKSVSSSEYYEVLYEKLNTHMYSLLEKAKLPHSVGEGVISENQVYIDGKVYINSVLKGRHPVIETAEIEEKLQDNIVQYLQEQGIETEPMADGIREIVDTVVIDYNNSLQFKLADYFYEYSSLYHKWGTVVLLVNLILVPIIVFLLLFTHHRKYHGMPYISYAVLSATIINTIVTAYSQRSVKGWSILQGDEFYRQMAFNYLHEGIMQGYYISIAGGILLLVLLMVTVRMKG